MRILLSRGLVYQAKNETRKNNLRETPLAVTKNKKETKKTSFKIATNSKNWYGTEIRSKHKKK